MTKGGVICSGLRRVPLAKEPASELISNIIAHFIENASATKNTALGRVVGVGAVLLPEGPVLRLPHTPQNRHLHSSLEYTFFSIRQGVALATE